MQIQSADNKLSHPTTPLPQGLVLGPLGATLLHQDWPFTPFGSQAGSLPGFCASTQHGNMPESLWSQWNHTGNKAPLQKGLRWASGVPGKAQNPLKECGKKRAWLTTPAMRVNKKTLHTAALQKCL